MTNTMTTSRNPRVGPNLTLVGRTAGGHAAALALNGAHAGRMRPILNELERLASEYTALADHADVRSGKLTIRGFLTWATERVQADRTGERAMNPLTAHQLRRRLNAPDVTTFVPDGGYRLDVDVAIAEYLKDPARFHAVTPDNPHGDPVLNLILNDGPWWVPRGGHARFRVTHHGSTIAEVASYLEALHVIHQHQPQSAAYALAHGDYAIQEVNP